MAFFDGRLTVYPALGLLSTDTAGVELSRTQMAICMALLDAKGELVPREALIEALGQHGGRGELLNVVSVHCTHIRDRFAAAGMPLEIGARQGQGLALVWKGSWPADVKRYGNGRGCQPKPRAPDARAAQAAIQVRPASGLPAEVQAEIKSLRHRGGKDRGGSVTWIAKRLDVAPAEVAAVLGVTWGVSS